MSALISIKYYVLCIMQMSFGLKGLLKFLVFLLLTTYYLLHTTSPVLAQSPIPTYVSPTSPVYTDLLVHNLFHTFSCLAVGSSIIGKPCLSYQNGIPVLSKVNLQGGALGATTSLIGALYAHPPVRTIDYLASVGQGLGIVKEAKAQVIGSGAQVLNPILTLWQVSRNISYVFMIIIFVVIGLMVMFRNKINPQTVITAQAALPGLVIGLVMITFSFFLAGLVADMAFVGTNVVGYYFSIAQRPSVDPQNLVQDIQSQNVLSLFTPFTKAVTQSKVSDAINSIWNDLHDPSTCPVCPWDMDPQKVLTTLTAFVVSQIIMPFGGMFGGPGQIVAGIISFGGTAIAPPTLASIALSFVAMAILIYAMFRLMLRLINNYITIIFLTITAPFQFLASALPGRQGIATNWILNMLANVLAFPAVLAVLYFVAYLLGPNFIQGPAAKVFKITQNTQGNQQAIVPVAQAATKGQIVAGETFPLFGGLDLDFIHLLLAFGALVALPAIPDIIARTIGRVGVAGQLIGQELGGSYGAGRGYAGQASQGATGIAGQVGRLTPETHYYKEGGELKVSPSLSRAGQVERGIIGFKTLFGKGPKPSGTVKTS